jgi:hypothetical protein
VATSTSKPLIDPSGFFTARPGWSNFVPMVIVWCPPEPHAATDSRNAIMNAAAATLRSDIVGSLSRRR